MGIFAGIDAGSRAVKVVLIDGESLEVIGRGMLDQGVHADRLAEQVFLQTLETCGVAREDVAGVVATGYGRYAVSFATAVITEITCHARGVHHLLPDAATVLEIGGQDSKLLRLYADGSVHDFSTNDRCAAGTGRFLEVVATRLGVTLDQLGGMAARSEHPAAINDTCVVFAEAEIIGLLADGASPEDIVAGVQRSLAQRAAKLATGKITAPVVFTGGVAQIPRMDVAMAEAFGVPVVCAPDPQYTGALGAALLARSGTAGVSPAGEHC